jgi:hypothetical protein
MRKPLGAVICVALLVGAAEAKTRTWTDGSGQQVRAEFVRVHDGEAVLSSAGKTLLVPLRNLSPQDQAWIQAELAKKEVRGWRRTDGQELRGKYLGYDDGQVRIRAGGTTVPVPLAELSRRGDRNRPPGARRDGRHPGGRRSSGDSARRGDRRYRRLGRQEPS